MGSRNWREVQWQLITSLNQLIISQRLGLRTHPQVGHRYYGGNAAAFSATFTQESWLQISIGNPSLQKRGTLRVVVRIVWNYDHTARVTDITKMAAHQLRLLGIREGTLPLHPNVMPILHHFVQTGLPTAPLPDIDTGDPEIIAPHRLCALYPQAQLNLSQLLTRRQSPLAEMEVLHLGCGVTAGLLHLYQHEVIHRDFKLDNIFILWPDRATESGCPESSDQETKRLQFLIEHRVICCLPVVSDLDEHLNFAQIRDPDLRQRKRYPLLREAESRGGALIALSPEILAATLDDEYLNYSANDAWALGVVLFQMLSHPNHKTVTPFAGVEWHQMKLADIAKIPLLDIELLPSRYSPTLRSLVVGLLHPDPSRRLTLEVAHASLSQQLG